MRLGLNNYAKTLGNHQTMREKWICPIAFRFFSHRNDFRLLGSAMEKIHLSRQSIIITTHVLLSDLSIDRSSKHERGELVVLRKTL